MESKFSRWAFALSLLAASAFQANAQSRTGLISVTDGNRFTLKESGIAVQLYGIETCDLKQSAFYNGVAWPCGIVAAGWLTQMTLGFQIKCLDEGPAGYATFYGRCFLPSGEDIAKLALEQGLAVAKRENGEPIEQSYALIEQQARDKKAGLWSSNFYIGSIFYRADASH